MILNCYLIEWDLHVDPHTIDFFCGVCLHPAQDVVVGPQLLPHRRVDVNVVSSGSCALLASHYLLPPASRQFKPLITQIGIKGQSGQCALLASWLCGLWSCWICCNTDRVWIFLDLTTFKRAYAYRYAAQIPALGVGGWLAG